MTNKEIKDAHDQDRLQYWNNDYVQYWKSRVEEANKDCSGSTSIILGDAATTGDIRYLQAIEFLEISSKHNVLELGCGFGRSLPTLSLLANTVVAVDISKQMIEVAQHNFSATNVSFHVSPSEDLPFNDEIFDRIICFAAFDAMFQSEALVEMHRVCKAGGRILLTGKNDNYCKDDQKAFEAECGARKKGHPNFFTDMKKLLNDLGLFGFSLIGIKYYERRGDFASGLEKTEMPLQFYEYLLVIQKTGLCLPDPQIIYYNQTSKTHAYHQMPSQAIGEDNVS